MRCVCYPCCLRRTHVGCSQGANCCHRLEIAQLASARQVETQLSAWREDEKKTKEVDLGHDFIDDCRGAKALRDTDQQLVMLWLVEKSDRVGFIGAIIFKSRRHITCEISRIYVTQQVRRLISLMPSAVSIVSDHSRSYCRKSTLIPTHTTMSQYCINAMMQCSHHTTPPHPYPTPPLPPHP